MYFCHQPPFWFRRRRNTEIKVHCRDTLQSVGFVSICLVSWGFLGAWSRARQSLLMALKEESTVEVSNQKRAFCFHIAELSDEAADGNSFFSAVTMQFFQALSHLRITVCTVRRPGLSSVTKSP